METKLVDAVTMHPRGTCYGCNTPAGPFAHLVGIDDGFGHLHFCKSCAAEIGRVFGFATPEEIGKLETTLHGKVEALTTERDEFAAEVAELKANLSVPLAEVIDFVRARENRRPDPNPQVAA